MKKKILVLPGDGIGPEVCDTVIPVLEQFNLPLELSYGEVGWECWKSNGDPIPPVTWEKIKKSDAILLGAITSKGKEAAQRELASHLQSQNLTYVSPVIQLRQKLSLYANIRPFRYIAGSTASFNGCVIRENTEGLYAGLDFRGVSDGVKSWLRHPNLEKYGPAEAAWSVRLQIRLGLERLFRLAFVYAQRKGLGRVTFADKPNVMRESGQFAKEIFDEVAADFPTIEAEIHNVDAVALWLVKKTQHFGVIVAENMFGDILSDLVAGIMGGLGLAPSANIGDGTAYFEPVHGSAPRLVGKEKANPAAMFYTVSLLLDYLNFKEEACRIMYTVDQVIRSEKVLTYDLGGVNITKEFSAAVSENINLTDKTYTASVITIGDELLSGQHLNTNLQSISQQLKKKFLHSSTFCLRRSFKANYRNDNSLFRL